MKALPRHSAFVLVCRPRAKVSHISKKGPSTLITLTGFKGVWVIRYSREFLGRAGV